MKLSLALIQIILAPARPVALVYIALHVHYAAVGGVGLPLKPLHCAVKKGHAHSALRDAVQEHDVVLFRTSEKLRREQRDALCDVGAALAVGVSDAV